MCLFVCACLTDGNGRFKHLAMFGHFPDLRSCPQTPKPAKVCLEEVSENGCECKAFKTPTEKVRNDRNDV